MTAEEAAEAIDAILALPTFAEQADAWRALLREDPFITTRDTQARSRFIQWGADNFDGLSARTRDVPYPHPHRERKE